MIAISCLDIELAIMFQFDIRKNIIVPNVNSMMQFETDVIVLTKANLAYGFEIKTSLSDLKAEFRKIQHTDFNNIRNGKTGLERYYSKFKHFYYAVPEKLKEPALELIPDFCGLWCLERNINGSAIRNSFKEVRKPKFLFKKNWTAAQRLELARLGTMRLYSLKRTIRDNQINKQLSALL